METKTLAMFGLLGVLLIIATQPSTGAPPAAGLKKIHDVEPLPILQDVNNTDWREIQYDNIWSENTAGTKSELQGHVRNKRFIVTAAALAVGASVVGIVSGLFNIGKGIYDLANPPPRLTAGETKIIGRLEDMKNELVRLGHELQQQLNTIQIEGEWRLVAARYGTDLNRLTYLITTMSQLTKSSDGSFILNDKSRRWADSVLSYGADGIGQVLMDVHSMVIGSNSVIPTGRPIVSLFMDWLPKDDGQRFTDLVQKYIDILREMQVSGYSCWIVALAIQNRDNEIPDVDSQAKQRLQQQQNIVDPDMKRYFVWPSGGFGLVEAVTSGCPDGAGHDFHRSSRYHDNEDSGNEDLISDPNHFIVPSRSTWHLCRDTPETWRFCTRKLDTGLDWPSGSYCLLSYQGCPRGFGRGNIYFDDEDDDNNNKVCEPDQNTLPDGDYNANTKYYFCCRNDGSPLSSISLPVTKPFFLFRYKGTCQKVHGLDVSEEWYRWDNEDSHNYNHREDPHPDDTNGGKNIELRLCYYHY